MLGCLCSSDQFQLFVTRLDHIQSLNVFPENLQIPDWFGEKLSELLETSQHKDKNTLYKLVTFSLCSSIQVRLH